MRLGAQPTKLEPGSLAAKCYGTTEVSERHRHRYEFNNRYRQQFAAHGMQFSGTSPDGSLVEIVELPEHPWFLAVQFHPEFKSKPTTPQPLFAGFIGAAVEHNKSRGERDAAKKRPKKTQGRKRRSPLHRVPIELSALASPICGEAESWPTIRKSSSTRTGSRRSRPRKSGRETHEASPSLRQPHRAATADDDRSADAAGVVRDAGHDARDRSADGFGQVPHPVTGKIEAAAQSGQVSDRYGRRSAAENEGQPLTTAEQQVIDSLLHQMRLVFVAVTNEPAPAAEPSKQQLKTTPSRNTAGSLCQRRRK